METVHTERSDDDHRDSIIHELWPQVREWWQRPEAFEFPAFSGIAELVSAIDPLHPEFQSDLGAMIHPVPIDLLRRECLNIIGSQNNSGELTAAIELSGLAR